MIFVTVGTHEQQFNRLIEYMDNFSRETSYDVIIQTGYCTYVPKYSTFRQFYSYKEMVELVNNADIIITHGGPSSFMSAVKVGKIPLVVPRLKEYGEHVNNHQLVFCKEIEKRYGYIKVLNVDELKDAIMNYDAKKHTATNAIFNNSVFCLEFEKIVNSLI